MDTESHVPEAPGDCQRASARDEALIRFAEERVDIRHERRDPASPAVVVQALGDGLGFAHPLQRPPGFTEIVQDWPQVETDVEGLLQGGRALWQRLENTQCLIESGESFLRRRPGRRPEPGLSEIVHRLLTQFTPERVMGEPLDLLPDAIPIQRLDRADDPRVQLPASVMQETAIGHLVSERMLEGVLEVGIEPGLVDELGGLQTVESAPERIVREVGDRLEEWPRHVLADDRGEL
jgi:hypothetical protein